MQALYGYISFNCLNSHSQRLVFDRFIPSRSNLDVELSHHRLVQFDTEDVEKQPAQYRKEDRKQYNNVLAKALGGEPGRILPTTPKPRHLCKSGTKMSELNRCGKEEITPKARRRRVSQSPDCIMDMPNLRDDFYTNILDWGNTNQIAVALNQTTYLWDPLSKVCKQILMDTTNYENYYISALSWDHDGKFLAVADNSGDIVTCDVERIKLIRQISQEKVPIGVVRWTQDGIFSGNKKGHINMFDVREPCTSPSHSFNGRQREVCGMQMSEGQQYFVTGGDDGLVDVWNLRSPRSYNSIAAHSGCTKALSWCPWRQSVLASGGGFNDGYIRLWHIHSSEKIAEAFTKSQVCGLSWSEEYRELLSSHGLAGLENNDIILWRMGSFEFVPVGTLRQHLGRPLHIATSPDRTTVVSVGADEAMCLWNCFPRRKRPSDIPHGLSLNLDWMIR